MAKDTKSKKEFTEDDVAEHKSEDDCWLIINDEVYDVTKYLDDHPGGSEVMMEFAGGDGTTMFEDVGHSSEARQTMKKFVIGSLKGGAETSKKRKDNGSSSSSVQKSEGGLSPLAIIFLLLAIVAGVYFTQQK